MRLLVIYNPKARAGRAGKLLREMRDAFAALQVDAEFALTQRAGHATELAAAADLNSYGGVVAAGGDGTVHEVLNGMFMHEPEDRIPLGVVPVGTGNAFARELGLRPRDWRQAVGLIARGRTRPCDVGRVETGDDLFYFLNVTGMGFVSDAGLTAKRLKFVGNGAYTLGTLWQVLKLRSYALVIEVDGKKLERDNVFIEISNSRYTGTKFLIAPRARIDDGRLDVTLLRKLGRGRLLRLFPTVYSGRHLAYGEVETFRARRIRIESPAGMLMTVDGEFRGRTPLTIECLPGVLDLLA